MTEEENVIATWDARIDNALMNAEALLAQFKPESLQEAISLADSWVYVAAMWTNRQTNELAFVAAALELEEEEEEVES